MLTAILLVPFLAALLILLTPRDLRFGIRLIALAATLLDLVLVLVLFLRFDTGVAGYQFVQCFPWVSALGINYHVGVDGINIGLLVLGAVVAFAATCVSWEIRSHEKEFYGLLLVMSGGILGAFASLDLFFFYAFHELALVPTFIMIGVWGRGDNKNYATFNLTLYLSAGALLALVGLIALYLNVPQINYVAPGATYSPAPTPAGSTNAPTAAPGVYPLQVVPGQRCTWTRGTNDLRLVNGAVAVTNSGPFIAATNVLLIVGKGQAPVTAAVVNHPTFDLVVMTDVLQKAPLSVSVQNCIFPLLLFGFGILVSLWPFHTWAPLGYGAAPTPTAMLHAGVLKKFGLYGLIRIALPLLPEGASRWLGLLALLCLGNILHCGWVAMRQRDLNQLIGNSSVAHMGFAFLGIASLSVIGVTGAVMVMVAHGFLAALTFGLSGYLYHQTGTLEMGRLGGLLRQLPFIGAAMVMAMLAGCGLPGFANFAGEVLVLFGTWQAARLASPQWFVVLAAWGALVIGALYMMRAIRQIFHGPLSPLGVSVSDAACWRRVPFVLLLAALLIFGCFPRLLTDKIKPSVAGIVHAATRQSLPLPQAAGIRADQSGLAEK